MLLNAGGVVESTRQKSVTLTPLICSSTMRAEMAMASVDLGTSGECARSRISGAMLVVKLELTRPGVPPLAALKAQFWPVSVPICGLRRSMDFPPPDAGQNHVQPRCPRSSAPRWRWAQSPSVPYETLSTVLLFASFSVMVSPLLPNMPSPLPTTLATPGYLAAKAVRLGDTTT